MAKKIKRLGLICSSGGAYGAYGAGTIARLNRNYDVGIGISTGSLIIPFALLQEYELLRIAYTNINSYDIFDPKWYKPPPLTSKGHINILAVIITLLLNQKTIGTTRNLKILIDEFFTIDIYNRLKEEFKEFVVLTQNYAQIPSSIHSFSSLQESHESMKDYMYASASPPMLGSLVKKSWEDEENKFHVGLFTDGGVTLLLGLEEAINKNLDEVDVILHRTKPHIKYEGNKINNLMSNILTTINSMRYALELQHLYEKIKILNQNSIKVNLYWLPRKLSNNSLIFNKEQMTEWFEEGYDTALNPDRIETFLPNQT